MLVTSWRAIESVHSLAKRKNTARELLKLRSWRRRQERTMESKTTRLKSDHCIMMIQISQSNSQSMKISRQLRRLKRKTRMKSYHRTRYLLIS